MSLKQNIDASIKQAMLAKDQDSLRALRAVKSALLIATTEKGADSELSDEDGIKILMKLVKQRKDSAELYKQQNREDLLEKEIVEIDVIEKFLPKQLSEDELKDIIQSIITKVGATSPQDMGKVMGAASKELAGKADGKTISTVVKSLLS